MCIIFPTSDTLTAQIYRGTQLQQVTICCCLPEAQIMLQSYYTPWPVEGNIKEERQTKPPPASPHPITPFIPDSVTHSISHSSGHQLAVCDVAVVVEVQAVHTQRV